MQNEFTNICLITFNRLEYTKQSIQSILRTTQSKWKLTVVDNGSTDGTVEYLQKLYGKSHINNLVCLDANIGVARAANIAWLKEPNARFFVKIDNDIIVKKDNWLFDMINLVKANTGLGLVGYNVENKSYPLMENENGTRLRKTASNIGGAAVLIPSSTRNLIGYWSEEYGLYGEEDADYSARIQAVGLDYAYMEDEDAMFHLPGGKAAEIDPKTFVARAGLENEDFPAYRIWKDEERKKNLVQGGLYVRNLIGYQNKWMPIFKPATYASVIVNKLNTANKNTNLSLVSTKIIDALVKVKYTLIVPLLFDDVDKIENALKIIRTAIDHSGNAPDKIIFTSVTSIKKSALNEILKEFDIILNHENAYATRDDLIVSAASMCTSEWIIVLDPYLLPPMNWVQDMFFIAEKNHFKLIGGSVIDTNSWIDHMGFGVNQVEMKYEKLFSQMYLGSPNTNDMKALPSPYFFCSKTEFLNLGNAWIKGESRLLKIFENAIDKVSIGILKIPALNLLAEPIARDEVVIDDGMNDDFYFLENIYKRYFLNIQNKSNISQLDHSYEEISILFENAKKLIRTGKVFQGEVILSNLGSIFVGESDYWSSLGKFYFDCKMFDKATDAYEHVLKLGIKSVENFQNLGMAAYSAGRYFESTQYFDDAIKLVNGDKK